jgi:hypothetical protein
MHHQSSPIVPISYEHAEELWQARQVQKANLTTQTLSTTSHQVKKLRRLLAIARAQDWARSTFGPLRSDFTDAEDTSEPLPEDQGVAATKEDIKLHIHKAVAGIGLGSDESGVNVTHPIIQKEFILLLVRFRSSSLPTNEDFALLVRTYLICLNQATQKIDEILCHLKTNEC